MTTDLGAGISWADAEASSKRSRRQFASAGEESYHVKQQNARAHHELMSISWQQQQNKADTNTCLNSISSWAGAHSVYRAGPGDN